MLRSLFALVLLCTMTALGASGALAAKRVALVIGNDAYRELPPLQKAVADADSFAAAMTEQGFDQVILKRNLDRSTMDLAIAEFLELIEVGDTAVFFYSGHGWSDGAQNFLVGVDAPRASSETLLARISIPLQNGATGIIDEIGRKGAALKVAIIDACRDNPFASNVPGRSIGLSRGLVAQQPPSGTFIVFSAGAGQTALDRLSNSDPDPNSVFTRTFLPLVRARLPLLEAIKQTQQQVYDLALQISHEQEPAYYDQVRGSACLSESCNADGTVVVPPPLPVPAPGVPEDEKAYEAALSVGTCGALNAFARAYPDSFYAVLAREKAAAVCAPVVEPTPTPAPAPEFPPLSGSGDYFVILGSYSHAKAGEARERQRALVSRGVDAQIIDTDDYPNLADGLYAIVLGPFSRQSALDTLPYAKDHVRDAYVKSGY